MRQALKEVALEEAARKKADAAVARAEAELKAIIKDADQNPRAPLEPIRAKVREAKRAGHKELQAVLSEEQLRALADRAQKIALQATFLASPPDQLVQALSKMNPTKEQSERIRAFAAAEAAEVRKVTTDPDRTHRQMLDDMDRMAEVALAARAELRTILTEEQFRRFDTGFSLDVPDEQAAGAAAGAERPGPAGDRARAPKGAGPSEPRPPSGK